VYMMHVFCSRTARTPRHLYSVYNSEREKQLSAKPQHCKIAVLPRGHPNSNLSAPLLSNALTAPRHRESCVCRQMT